MLTQEQLFKEIDSVEFERPLASLCKKIAAYIISSKKIIFYYVDFLQACDLYDGTPEDLHAVQLCINFLKSKKISLIRQEYRYEYEDVLYEVAVEDLQAAYENDSLYIDYLGFSDSNWRSKVYIVFVPAVRVLQ